LLVSICRDFLTFWRAQNMRPSVYHAAFFSDQRHLILRVTSKGDDQDPLITEMDQHELSRLLRNRLAVLKAALGRVDELSRKAAKARND
jgi:hypothetical protein